MTDLDFHYSPPSVAAFAANDSIARSLPQSLETAQLSKHARLETRVERQLFLNLIRPDPKHNTSIEDQVSSDASPRTCEWINSDSEFLSWRHSPEPRVLFVVAGPGRGKSVLAKYIVQELRKGRGARRNTVLEFRCGQSSGSSSTVAILKSFLFHLVNTQPSLFRYVKPWFGARGDVGNVETFENLWPTFINVLRDPDVGMVHCVVDGFDECTTASQLLSAIRSLKSNKTLSGRFLITSRPSALPIDIDFPLLEVAEENTRTDVQLYVEHRIQNLPRSVEDAKQLLDLKILVVENAESSFLWAKLAMNEVENLAAVYRQDPTGNTPNLAVGVESVLRSPFREAEAFYRESLQRVAPGHRELVKDLLHTAKSAVYPLDSFSFAQAVGIDLIVGDERQAMSTHMRLLVRRYCSPFLTIDEDDDTVHFSHQSAREFLSSESLSKSDLSFFYQDQATASLFMARKCLACLMKELGSEASEGIDEERAGTHMDTNAQTDMDAKYLSSWENSFLSYAGWHWNYHTFQCQDRISALEDVLFPFLLSASAWNMWAAFLYRDLGNRDIGEGRETLFSPDLPLLHVLARYDLTHVIDHLLSIASPDALDPSKIANRILEKIPDLDVNRKDSFGHSALWMSIFWQSEATVILLLDVYQADVNIVDNEGAPLLHYACQTGNETIIRALFKTTHNLEVEVKDSDGQTALMRTIRSGALPIADLLISFGADLWTQDFTQSTTLHEAVRSGWEGMVKTLLNAGLSPQARSVDGWTPLHEVSRSKSLPILKMLLENGGDIHSENKDGLQVFHEAVRAESREDIDQLLLCEELIRLGCSLEKKAGGGWTPLHLASSAGSTAVVELLLDHKVDIDVRTDLGETPLYLAAFEGHHQVLELLIRRKANSLLRYKDGKTPLQIAAIHDKLECVTILVEARPNDINVQSEKGLTALANAAANDRLEVVRVLLEKRADPDIADPFGITPLLQASFQGHLRIVEVLLPATKSPNAKTKTGWTAVYTAVYKNNLEVAEYLVRNGVDCESKSEDGIAPVHVAAENGQVGIISTLLSVGVDVNMRTERFKHTPLLIGAQNGHESVVDLLLKSDADPTIRTTTGWSSLHAAATSGNVQIFRKLQQYFELLNPVNDQLYTPIHEAAAKGNIEIVKLLLDNDVRVDVQDSARWQPLHFAAEENQIEVLRLLLERGADVDERNWNSCTTAHIAASKGHIQILKKLEEWGADLNARDWNGYSILHCAAGSGSVLSLEFLVSFTTGGPNVTTCDGATPLHVAAYEGNFDAVKFLLQISASPAAFSIIDGAPSTLASREKHHNVVRLLDQQSPQDMTEDEFGLTSLDYSSKKVLSGSKPSLRRCSRLIISLLYRINRIKSSIALRTSYHGFNRLGRVLMILDEKLEDAQIAFEMRMTTEEETALKFPDIKCNLCSENSDIHEKRYICLSCPKLDFCKKHYNFYKTFSVCRNHDFLETSNPEDGTQQSDFQCAMTSDEHEMCGKRYSCTNCSNVELCESHYESYRTLRTCQKHEFSEVVRSEQPTNDDEEPPKPRCKTGVDDHDIQGKQYTCKTCSNVSLCATHFDSYDIFDVCTGHQFIEVPRPSWKPGKVPLGAVNEDGLLLGDWLEALRAKWYEILRRISPKTLGFFEHMHPQYLANPERYLERIEHLQSEVYNDCLLTQLFEVGTASKQLTHNSPILEQDQDGMLVSELDNLGLRGQLVSSYLPLANMPSADSSELEQITTHLKRNYTMCSQAMIAIERLQDAGHCSSYFSIFVIDRSRSDVASLKRVTKHMVENFQQLLGIVTHVFETKTLQIVDPASETEPPKLSNILEELDDEAYDFLRSLGIAEDSRAQGQTLLSLMSSCTILSHVLLLGISAYAGSHSSLFAEELFGLSLTDFRLSRPSGDIFFSLMDLACMHDFIGGPIWVFTEESRLIHTEKLCVSMYATDLDDLWGPAYFRSKNGSDQVELIEIERGAIVKIRDSSQHDEVVCHYVAWDAVEAQGLELPPELSPFSRESELLIGAPSGYESTDASPQCRFDVNPDCNYVADMLQSSPSWTPEGFEVVHLGVTEARWTLDSMVVSGHAGKVVGFGGSLGYKRTPKQNHRARIAMCFTNEGVDIRLLGYRFGLEVSACTQNARRTTLWDCIKSPRVREKVENSCEGIEPRYLEALNSEKNFRALWKFGRWTEENSKPLTDILKVIFTFLSYTGIDSRGHLRAWWDLDNLIELPHSRNSWIDMISHTENGVFAYVSESCLQCHCAGSHGTEGIRCRRRTDKSGKGRTAYFTALSYEEQRDELQTQPPAPEAPSTGTATDETAKIPESTSKQAQPPTRYTEPMLDTEWLKLNCKPMKEALNPPLQRYGGIQAAREEIPNHNDFSRPFGPQVREENRRQRSQRERLERVRALTREALSDSVLASSTLLFDSPSVRAARSDRRRMRSRFLHDEFLDPRNQDFLGSDHQIGSSGRFPQRTLDNQFHRTARESNGEEYASVDSRVDYSFGHRSATRMEQQPASESSKMKIPIQTQQIRGSRLPMDASRGFPSQCSANEALPDSSDDQAHHLQSEKSLVPGNLRLFAHNKPLRLSPLAVLHPVRDQHIPVFKGLHIPLFKSIPVPAHPERWNDAESSQRPLLVQFDFNMSPSMFFENATVSVVEKGLETVSKIPGTYRPTQRAARRFSDRIEDSGKRVVLTEVIDDLSAKGMVVPVCVISV